MHEVPVGVKRFLLIRIVDSTFAIGQYSSRLNTVTFLNDNCSSSCNLLNSLQTIRGVLPVANPNTAYYPFIYLVRIRSAIQLATILEASVDDLYIACGILLFSYYLIKLHKSSFNFAVPDQSFFYFVSLFYTINLRESDIMISIYRIKLSRYINHFIL